MKITDFLVAGLAASVANASSNPIGLFAKIGNRSVPIGFEEGHPNLPFPLLLDHKPAEITFGGTVPFSQLFDGESAENTIVSGFAKTKAGYVGSSGNFLVHGPRSGALFLNIRSDYKVTFPSFYYSPATKTEARFIFTEQDKGRVPVDIYLMPFDRALPGRETNVFTITK